MRQEPVIVFFGGVIPRQDYDFLDAADVKSIQGPRTPAPDSARDVLSPIDEALASQP